MTGVQKSIFKWDEQKILKTSERFSPDRKWMTTTTSARSTSGSAAKNSLRWGNLPKKQKICFVLSAIFLKKKKERKKERKEEKKVLTTNVKYSNVAGSGFGTVV